MLFERGNVEDGTSVDDDGEDDCLPPLLLRTAEGEAE
jgi:hypothetical protein